MALQQYPAINILPDAKNLRSRVSYTRYFTIADSLPIGYQSATYYSYDVHGNVDSLMLDYKDIAGMNRNNRFKKIVYRYDLISGKVNEVTYQPGQPDAFHHRYYYDAENRLIEVHTSKDSLNWEQDASYTYYKHGPLARVLLGHQSVQGVDYAYTLQGWLKGVNGTSQAYDIGIDSMPVAKDAYGFALYYYGQNDYKPIGGVRPFANADTGIVAFKPLYNGNIAAMAVNIPKVGEPLLYKYSYDQLNRITGMDAYRGLNVATNTWTPISTNSFKEAVKYDPNGNILSYLRNGNNLIGKPLAMDSMTYHYIAGTNQLDYITDPVNKNNYKEDIDNQTIHNYTYDSIGNLIKDNAEKISRIEWTVYGKISRILKTDTTEISYIYDAAGQRIAKAVKKNNITDSTYYVRDASGNVMSVYELNDTVSRGHVLQKEIDLYGSSRLGMLIAETDVDSMVPLSPNVYFTRGKKRYELVNHLGNVLVVISDVKKPIRSLTDTNLVVGYEPKVVTATDYYPFGMQMPGRHGFATETGTWQGSYGYSIPAYLTVNHRSGNTPPEYTASVQVALDNGFLTGAGSDNYTVYISDSAMQATADSAYQLVGNGYRYGFNGQEHSTELNNDDYTAQFWEYDGRTGRRWNLDPKPRVGISDYSTFDGNPIFSSDPLGDNPKRGAGLLKNMAKGFKDGAKSSKEFIKSLATKQGWKNLANGIIDVGDRLTISPSGLAKNAESGRSAYEAIINIPNLTRDDVGYGLGYGTEKIAESILLSKGASIVGKGAAYLGSFTSGEKYLESVNMTSTFESGSARFSLKFGEKGYVYHEAEAAAIKTPWSSPESFALPSEAYVKMALNYKSSANFASYKFSLKNWGLYVEGKAAAQNITLGGGNQSLRTLISVRTNMQSSFWWRK